MTPPHVRQISLTCLIHCARSDTHCNTHTATHTAWLRQAKKNTMLCTTLPLQHTLTHSNTLRDTAHTTPLGGNTSTLHSSFDSEPGCIRYIFTQRNVYFVGHTVYFPPTPLLLPLAYFFDGNPSSPSSTFAFLLALCPLRIHHKQSALLINVLNYKKKKGQKKIHPVLKFRSGDWRRAIQERRRSTSSDPRR